MFGSSIALRSLLGRVIYAYVTLSGNRDVSAT